MPVRVSGVRGERLFFLCFPLVAEAGRRDGQTTLSKDMNRLGMSLGRESGLILHSVFAFLFLVPR